MEDVADAVGRDAGPAARGAGDARELGGGVLACDRGLTDGDYTATITREDAAAELARIPRAARRGAGISPDGVSDILHSRFKLSLRHGTFALYQRHADGTLDVGIQGTYSLYRDRFVGRGSNGDTLRARWSFDGTKLRFSDLRLRRRLPSRLWRWSSWGSLALSRSF